MAGFDNDVMYADNVDFSGGNPVTGKITSNGQLLIGSTVAPNIRVGTPTNGNNIQWTLGAGTITAAVVGPPSPTSLTNHGVVIGQGTSALVATAAGSAGQVLQSGGASADPTYSTATYPSIATGTGTILRADGTNWSATTATYPNTTTVSQILYSSSNNTVTGLATANNGTLVTSNTGVPSILANGTTGQVLTATTGAPPSWATSSIVQTVTGQLFTSSGAFTYTPTSGMKYVIVELIGGGGGSGGIATNTGNTAATGGGGGGAYAKFILTAAQVGASLTGSVGAAGLAGTSGNNAGGNGGDTTLATTAAWTVGGGAGSSGSAAAASIKNVGGAGGTVTTGTGTILASTTGADGSNSVGIASFVLGGLGGSSQYGRGGLIQAIVTSTSSAGTTPEGYGAGAGGAAGINAAAQAGFAGNAGAAIFTEFL